MVHGPIDRTGELSTFVRGTSTRAVAQLLWKAAGFATAVLIVRVLPAPGAGTYFFAVSTGALWSVLLGLGLFQSITREGPRWDVAGHADETNHLFRSAGLILFIGSFLLIAAILVASAPLSWIAAGLIAAAAAYQQLSTSLFRVRGRPLLAEVNQALTPVAFLAFLLVMGTAGVSLVDTTVVIGARVVLEGAVALVLLFHALRLVRSGRTAPARRHVRSSLPLWLTGLAWIAIEHADIFLLGILRTESEVAAYTPSLRLAEVAALPFGMLLPYLIVSAARLAADGDMLHVQRLYTSVNKVGIALAAPLSSVLVVAPEPTLVAVFGIQNSDAAQAMRILGVTFIGHALLGGTSGVAEALLPLRYLVVRSGFTIVVAIPVTAAFIAQWGTIGAALGTAAGYFTVLSMNAILLWRRQRLIPIERDALFTFCTAAVSLALVSVVVDDPALPSALIAAVLIGLATTGVAWASARPGERAAIRQALVAARSRTNSA